MQVGAEQLEHDLVFAGLIGIIDPPRPEAKAAVARARKAGIRPVMITGDHPITAAVIGGMTSLPGAFVGGIVIGCVQSLSNWAAGHYYIGDKIIQEILPGSPDVVLLLLLLTVLIARPQGLLGSEA